MINQENKKIAHKIVHNTQKTGRLQKRKNTTSKCRAFSFWYVIERFLLLCSAIYKAWGMLLPKEKSIYELEFIRAHHSWGK